LVGPCLALIAPLAQPRAKPLFRPCVRYRRALLSNTRRLGEDHQETLAALNNLAVCLKKQQKLDEAEKLYRRALAGQERRLGPQHPDTLESVSNLAVLLKKHKKKKEAERFFRRAMLGRDIQLGGNHPVSGRNRCLPRSSFLCGHVCYFYLRASVRGCVSVSSGHARVDEQPGAVPE